MQKALIHISQPFNRRTKASRRASPFPKCTRRFSTSKMFSLFVIFQRPARSRRYASISSSNASGKETSTVAFIMNLPAARLEGIVPQPSHPYNLNAASTQKSAIKPSSNLSNPNI